MKRKFTKLFAALALLVCMTPSLVGWGQTREDITDVIDHNATASNLGNTGTTTWATNFTLTGTSEAEYYIHSMGTKDTENALQWNSNGFLYMTKTCSGHRLKSVTITTTANKNIGIYAQTTAYSAAPTGTALSTLAATSEGATYTFESDYTYLALKGTASSTSITNITIVWEEATITPTYTVTYNANGGSGEMVDENSPYEANATVTLLDNTFTAPEGMMWSAWEVKDAAENVITVTDGTFTMPASNVTVTAQWVADPNATQYEWVLTNLADLTSEDIFVIVGTASNASYSMSNNNGTSSAPTATAVTIESERITSTVTDNIKWNISGNATDGYTFYPNGSTTTWLYCTNTNNGVRVGTNDNKTFEIKDNYLYHTSTSRYVGIYSENNTAKDWRCYTSINSNITGQSFSFYKRQVVSTDPYIVAGNVELAYDATEGTITYELHNATGDITATTDADWITSLTPDATTSTVAIVCETNPSNEPREATIELAYGNATKEVTVTQAFNPNAPLTTMDQIFARATEVGSTATDVTITFGNWVVSGKTNSNAYVTDGTKGFIIYASSHGFEVGNVLSGTVSCKVQLYRGSAELTTLTSANEDLTVEEGGTVSVADIAITDLSGVNTGALLSYENLTYNGTALVDGNGNTITPYTTLYSYSFVSNHIYNVTGIYVQYNSTKEILPRSAEDIEEVVESYTLTINGYTDDDAKDGYYLIASPVTVNPANVEGMTTGDYDLYSFDQSEDDEWRNYKASAFNLEPGKGYLYAKKATTETPSYEFTLTGTPYSGNGQVALSYEADAEFAGWNLIGNPLGSNAELSQPYYRLNTEGSALNASTESSAVGVMEGVFVEATEAGQTATFTAQTRGTAAHIAQANIVVNQNGTVVDNAIVRFDGGSTLGKLQLFEGNAKVYFTEEGRDYAIVSSEAQGEMPVNFKAIENGTYTLSVDVENVEMTYLHLIDNMTGADVDLLSSLRSNGAMEYSFEAKTTDYASRFRLVFNANNTEENGASTGSATFAFFSNGNLIVDGTGTLQVIDVLGRVHYAKELSTANCQLSTNNFPAGVYMLRLINGNEVKVQKIVVR